MANKTKNTCEQAGSAKAENRSKWMRGSNRHWHDRDEASFIHDLDDEAEIFLTGDDRDAHRRGAERLLGRRVREVV